MADAPAMASPSDARQSTRERLADLQNMSPKEVRDYLASDEFAKHGSKAVAGNAKRLLALSGGGHKSGLSLEDSELLRNAISVIERAKYASGHELPEALVKAKAYGCDIERNGGAETEAPTPDAESDDDPGDPTADDGEEEE